MNVDTKKGDQVKFIDKEDHFLVTLSVERAREILGDDVVGRAYAEAEGPPITEESLRNALPLAELWERRRAAKQARAAQQPQP